MKAGTKVLVGLGAVVALVAVVLGGWSAGWWFNGKNINIQAHQVRTGYEAQKTYRDQIQVDMTTVANIGVQIATPANVGMKEALTAQRQAVVNEICQLATNLTSSDINPSESQFITINCPEGTLR